jgi:hypothetical protein
MKACLVLSLSLVTLPYVGGAAEPPAPTAPAPTAPATASAPTETKAPETVRVVTIDPNARPPVCRRVVPTGSRIAEQRCESAKPETTVDAANRAVVRRDIEAMRDQQMLREQARQAAMAEALRRRGQ